MLTKLESHQNNHPQELYLTAINGSVVDKLALANDPSISTPIAKILRYDRSKEVRKAIINNPNVPNFFYRGVNLANIADIIIDMVDAANNHTKAARLLTPIQGEVIRDREYDADSDIAVIELKGRVAVTTGELTIQNIRDGLPITYDVWTLPESDNEPMTFELETANLQEAMGIAVQKLQQI